MLGIQAGTMPRARRGAGLLFNKGFCVLPEEGRESSEHSLLPIPTGSLGTLSLAVLEPQG